jgi:hypothetical protein
MHSETLPCPAPPLLRRAAAAAAAAAGAGGARRRGGRGGCRCMRAGGAGAHPPARSLAAVVRLAAPSASVCVLLYQ